MKIKPLYITNELHERLKEYAKKRGFLLWALAEIIIKDFLDKQKNTSENNSCKNGNK